MYKITAIGERGDIEVAGMALADMDPSPASAIDTKEENRFAWRLDAYADDLDRAAGCAGIVELVSPTLIPQLEELEDIDWVAKSLEGLPPIFAGPFIVAGSHALTEAHAGRVPVLIEAGPAFGTGHHGTTLGCLLAYAEITRRRPVHNVLDLGTGSGVLSIAALKYGAEYAIGTDIDASSVAVARENAMKNHVTGQFKAYNIKGGNAPIVRRRAPFDVIFANILARPLIALSPDIAALVAPGGHVILSGLLVHQEPLVRKAFTGRGLALHKRIDRDGWMTLVFKKTYPKRAARRAQRALRRAKIWGRSVAVPVDGP